MKQRKRMSKAYSKRSFKRSANRIHKYNNNPPFMRGGIRL